MQSTAKREATENSAINSLQSPAQPERKQRRLRKRRLTPRRRNGSNCRSSCAVALLHVSAASRGEMQPFSLGQLPEVRCPRLPLCGHICMLLLGGCLQRACHVNAAGPERAPAAFVADFVKAACTPKPGGGASTAQPIGRVAVFDAKSFSRLCPHLAKTHG